MGSATIDNAETESRDYATGDVNPPTSAVHFEPPLDSWNYQQQIIANESTLSSRTKRIESFPSDLDASPPLNSKLGCVSFRLIQHNRIS